MWHSLILILKKCKINTNCLIRSDLAKIWRLKAGKAALIIGVQGKSIGGFWNWYHQKNGQLPAKLGTQVSKICARRLLSKFDSLSHGRLLRNPIPKIPDGTTCPRIKTRVHPRIATEFGPRRCKAE